MLTCGKRLSLLDLVCLGPTSLRFWRVVVFPEGFFCCVFDVLVVLFVVVFVLFAFAFAVEVLVDFFFLDGVPVVVRHCWFFCRLRCVVEPCEDDFAVFDAPADRVTFFPLERVEDVVWDFDVVVFRAGILFNLSDELT